MGERGGEDGLLAQAEIAPLTGLAESLGIGRNEWIGIATQPLPETLRLTTFGILREGQQVNIEIDSMTQTIVATVERIMKQENPEGHA